jgi:hypothetical protein
LDVHAVLGELRAHDVLIVVLAKHQHERKRAEALADVADRDACAPASVRPHVGGGGAGAERERLLDDAHLRIDLHRARLHGHRPRLLSRAGVAVDDDGLDAAAGELVGEHQAGRAGTDDENVRVHGGFLVSFASPSTAP